MTLGNLIGAVNLARQRTRLEQAELAAQAHGATQIRVFATLFHLARTVFPLGDQADHRERRPRIKLGRMGILHAGHIAGIFHHGQLHAQANTQVRDLVFAGITNRGNLAFSPALAKAARDQNGIHILERIAAIAFQVFRIQIMDPHLGVRLNPGMHQRLDQRLVRFGQVDVLAHKGHIDKALRVFQRMHQLVPDRQVGRSGQNRQTVADDLVEHLVVQHLGNLVDRGGIKRLNHGFWRHVTEQRNLAALFHGDLAVGTAQQHIRLDTDLTQLFHRVLGRLGLQLTGGGDPR